MIADTAPRRARVSWLVAGDQDQVGIFLHGYESAGCRRRCCKTPERGGPRRRAVRRQPPQGGGAAFQQGSGRRARRGDRRRERHRHQSRGDWRRSRWRSSPTARAPRYPGLARPPIDEIAARKDARAIDWRPPSCARSCPNAGSYVSESNYFNPRWQQRLLGRELSAAARGQSQIRSRRAVLRPPRRRQRSVERRRLYSALKARLDPQTHRRRPALTPAPPPKSRRRRGAAPAPPAPGRPRPAAAAARRRRPSRRAAPAA